MKNMIKKFNKEKTYMFSKERYVEVSGIITETNDGEWCERIDGLEVEIISDDTGRCGDYLILASWCEEIDKTPKTNIQINKKEIELIIKSLDYLNNNNYFIEESESELAEDLIKNLMKKSKDKY